MGALSPNQLPGHTHEQRHREAKRRVEELVLDGEEELLPNRAC